MSASAEADTFGPISLASAGTLNGGLFQQAEYAHDAAISGDGRYVAFDGSVDGLTGVWRRDVATGVIEQVAGGDAELPSISEDGREISFTSTESLVAQDEARGPNVWVRNMEPAAGEPEYVLASAQNESSKGLAYEYGANPSQEEAKFGAVAVGRSAISANGGEVAFVTTAVSNLAGPQTPALQVAVRYLATDRTVLVSRCFMCADSSEPVSVEENGNHYGAVFPGSANSLGFTAPPINGKWSLDPPPGASISADGSAVAWMGEDIGKQARMLPDEHPPALYTEPLWRRIEPGSETLTERVTGGSDPGNPACAASGETVLPTAAQQSASDPCQGPFEVEEQGAGSGAVGIWPEGEGNFVPRLSGDGYTVAFLSRALPISLGLGFGSSREGPSDLYLADMHAGLTREEALTPLTEIAGEGVAAGDPITDFDISADGNDVAFTTRRTLFRLGSPAYVSPPAAEAGESELFDVDLADDTLTRVSHGYNGEPSEQLHRTKLECPEDVYCAEATVGAQSPSSSSDGNLLAFSSTASNLVLGDGNAPPAGPLDGSDAFLLGREVFVPTPTPQYISPAPQTPLAPLWQLGSTALSRADGSVLLYVALPGAGTLRAGAQASVVVKSAGRSSSKSKRAGHAHKAVAAQTLAMRTVATAQKSDRSDEGELVVLVLKLAKPYSALASRSGGLSTSVSLVFTAAGHHTLHGSLRVDFRRTIAPRRVAAKRPHASKARRKR
jgi:fructose-specific component phosphotransferase system IIB-like protein